VSILFEPFSRSAAQNVQVYPGVAAEKAVFKVDVAAYDSEAATPPLSIHRRTVRPYRFILF